MAINDPRMWSKAIQQLAPGEDHVSLIKRIERLRRGIPAEDEFSVIAWWLGRCRLVHKLDQFQTPPKSQAFYRIPDLMAVFEYRRREVPVLIEVKSNKSKTLSWKPDYYAALLHYAEVLNLPLLIAWKHNTFWVLFESKHLKLAKTNFNINFPTAMKHNLMSELAGDFSFSLESGSALNLRIERLTDEDAERGFDAIIRDVYYTRSDGKRVETGPGMLPLFLCLPNEATLHEEEKILIQSFTAENSDHAEFAHRAIVSLLRLFRDTKQFEWHRIIEEQILSPLADKLPIAANHAQSCGLLKHLWHFHPATVPDFLAR